jgi:predicted transcriptional regulator
MSKRRSCLEILYGIVNLCIEKDGILKTHIMNQTNQSWAQLKGNLKLLMNVGWIEEKKGRENNIYIATDKGRRFTQCYQCYNDILKEIPPEYLYLLLGERKFSKLYSKT